MKKCILVVLGLFLLASTVWAVSYSGVPIAEGYLTLSATAQNLRSALPAAGAYPGKEMRAVCMVAGDSCNYLLYDTPSQAEGLGFSAQGGDWIFLYGETQVRQFQAVLGEGAVNTSTLFYTIFMTP